MNHAAEYADHLARQDAAVQAFVDVLLRERDVLSVRPVAAAALVDVTEAKTCRAEALECLERDRQALAETARAGRDLDDAELARELDCSEAWATLCARIARARNQNAINGVAIHTRLEHTEARLTFLRRNAAGSLYAPNGQQRPTGTGRLRGDA